MGSREAALLLIALAALAPTAAAQEDPTLNESDFDESPPESNETYLDEEENRTEANASAGGEADPTLSEDDFDTGAPPADESYLDDAEREAGLAPSGSAGQGAGAGANTPGLGFAAVAGAVACVTLLFGRRG